MASSWGSMLLQDMAAKPEAVVEVVGTLASLCLPGFDWQSYLSRHALEYWLAARLVAGNVDDDIVLECIMLCGSACDEGSAPLLADAGIVRIPSPASVLTVMPVHVVWIRIWWRRSST